MGQEFTTGPDTRSPQEKGRHFTDSDPHVARVQSEQLEHRQVLPMMVTREAQAYAGGARRDRQGPGALCRSACTWTHLCSSKETIRN